MKTNMYFTLIHTYIINRIEEFLDSLSEITFPSLIMFIYGSRS